MTAITDTLKLSIAIELLTSRLDTEVQLFRMDKDALSDDDLRDMVKCCRFITENSRHNYSGTAIEIEEHLKKLNS